MAKQTDDFGVILSIINFILGALIFIGAISLFLLFKLFPNIKPETGSPLLVKNRNGVVKIAYWSIVIWSIALALFFTYFSEFIYNFIALNVEGHSFFYSLTTAFKMEMIQIFGPFTQRYINAPSDILKMYGIDFLVMTSLFILFLMAMIKRARQNYKAHNLLVILGAQGVYKFRRITADTMEYSLIDGAKMNVDLFASERARENIKQYIYKEEQLDEKGNPKPRFVSVERDHTTNIIVRLKDYMPTYIEFSKDILQKGKILIGFNKDGDAKFIDFKDTKHTLITGKSGSGKSQFVNQFIMSLAHNLDLTDKIEMIDFKESELPKYTALSNKVDCAVDYEEASNVILETQKEMKRRNKYNRDKGISNYDGNYIFLIIDEAQTIYTETRPDKEGKDMIALTQNAFRDILQKGRSANIRVIYITQRADAENINTNVRENLQNRVMMKVSNADAVRMSLGSTDWLDNNNIDYMGFPAGRMVFYDDAVGSYGLFQGSFIDDNVYKQFIREDEPKLENNYVVQSEPMITPDKTIIKASGAEIDEAKKPKPLKPDSLVPLISEDAQIVEEKKEVTKPKTNDKALEYKKVDEARRRIYKAVNSMPKSSIKKNLLARLAYVNNLIKEKLSLREIAKELKAIQSEYQAFRADNKAPKIIEPSNTPKAPTL